ncbi:MAG TPA: BA14K family protein [Pararhizobium sp.]|nr:BA14K family protein [Pararhizobium sp.]
MRPFVRWAGAAAVAIAAVTMTTPSASARGWHHWGHWHHHHSGAALGLGLGLLSGVIIGDALAAPYVPEYRYYPPYPYYRPYVYAPAYPVYRYRVPPRRYYRPGRLSRAHIDWCYRHYRSYRASDNTYQPYHGPRRACISPYG